MLKPARLLTGLGFIAVTRQHCSFTPGSRCPQSFFQSLGHLVCIKEYFCSFLFF